MNLYKIARWVGVALLAVTVPVVVVAMWTLPYPARLHVQTLDWGMTVTGGGVFVLALLAFRGAVEFISPLVGWVRERWELAGLRVRRRWPAPGDEVELHSDTAGGPRLHVLDVDDDLPAGEQWAKVANEDGEVCYLRVADLSPAAPQSWPDSAEAEERAS